MSGPVDVLAVMGGYCDLSTEMREARAAVAELIAAAQAVDDTKGSTSSERIRLRLALARVQGGAE